LRKHIHEVNLRLNATHKKKPKRRLSFFRVILLFLFLALGFSVYKLYQGYRSLKKVELEISYYPAKRVKVKPPEIHPPQEAEEEKKITSKPSPKMQMLRVVLTWGSSSELELVETMLKKEGIEIKKSKKRVTLPIYRVMVGGLKEKGKLAELKEKIKKVLPGINPWTIKSGKLHYLNVASLREMKWAQAMKKKLTSFGFNVKIQKAEVALTTDVVIFEIERSTWEKIKDKLPSKTHVLEENLLSQSSDFSHPISTTSQGKNSS